MKNQGSIFSLFTLVVLLSCESSLVYRVEVPPPSFFTEFHQVSEVKRGKMKIVWVIDNSGSMGKHQQKVKVNTTRFIEGLSHEAMEVDWQMVMLSTSVGDYPFLGFPTPFTSASDNVVETFSDAVSKLGTRGDTTERSFLPVLTFLESNSAFLSNDSFLVLFFLTDEKEQSNVATGGLSIPTARNFMDRIIQLKGGAEDQILIYGAFAFKDLQGCQQGMGQVSTQGVYKESRFRTIIEYSSKNKFFSACTERFGDEFARVASDMAQKAFKPQMVTEYRFIPETLQIDMGGVAIEGGKRKEAPYWLYDESTNIIRFFNLRYLPEDVGEYVNVHYQIDDGYDR